MSVHGATRSATLPARRNAVHQAKQGMSPPSPTRGSVQEDDGDPTEQILSYSMQVDPKDKAVEPQTDDGFDELIERLTAAHHRDLRDTTVRLESDMAELERQNKLLRSQLVMVDQKGAAGSWPQQLARGHSWDKKKAHHVTDVTDEPWAGGDHFHAPGSVEPSPPSDSAGVLGGAGAHESDHKQESKDGEKKFPPRSEYVDELMGMIGLTASEKVSAALEKPKITRTRASSIMQYRTRTVSAKVNTRNCYNRSMENFISSPRSNWRTLWEVVGSFLVCWDLFIVPLAVFCFPVNGLTIAMDWITLIFWTLNVPQTMTVGYESGLGTNMVPSLILWRYVKSWLFIDMVVLVPDWVIAALTVGGGKKRTTSCDSAVDGAETVKLLRNLRIMRLLRLTRIARLQRLWQILKERIYSQTVSIIANILTMLLLLLILSHFISCLWYAISDAMEGRNRWLIEYAMYGEKWNYLYATCLHWSLTQFTPAPMNIQPQNFPERVFNIHVVVGALVGFSYVVGSITGSLAQLRSLKEEESKMFWDLRVYLKRNCVEQTLSVRIQKYLTHAVRYSAINKQFQQVKILTMLSEQLQNELLFQLHANHLRVYPLIEKLLDQSKVTAFRLARTAISTKLLANHDPLFIGGEKPSHMYIVMTGQLVYKRVTSEGEVCRETVDKGEDWIAEPVLWSTQWYHLGDCTAVDASSLTLVNPHNFCEEAKRNPLAWTLVTTYCANFLTWLNSTPADELSDITQGDDTAKNTQLKGFMNANQKRASKDGTQSDLSKPEESFIVKTRERINRVSIGSQ